MTSYISANIQPVQHWNFIYASDVPKQRNATDCGAFCCYFSETIIKNIEFEQKDMQEYRRYIANIVEALSETVQQLPVRGFMNRRNWTDERDMLSSELDCAINKKCVIGESSCREKIEKVLESAVADWTFCESENCNTLSYENAAEWVHCVACRKWLHKACISIKGNPIYYLCGDQKCQLLNP